MRGMNDVERLETELNQRILAGRGMEAFEELYADDVTMQENLEAPCVGKDANRKRELEFFASIETFHGATLHSQAVGEGVSFSEWTYDFTTKQGARVQLNEVARRRWKDGKVVHERFYYQPGA